MARAGRTKLKSERIYFHRDSGKAEFIKIIYVDKESGEFIIPYPTEVVTAMNCVKEATDKDLNLCERKFKKMLNDFIESKESKRKVILYQFLYEDGTSRHDNIAFSDGLVVSLMANVFEETDTTRPNGTHSFSYETVQNDLDWSLKRSSHGTRMAPFDGKKAEDMIPWSEENEAFFNTFAKAMLSLIKKMNHMTKKPENLLAMIALKTNLLAAPESKVIPAEGAYRD